MSPTPQNLKKICEGHFPSQDAFHAFMHEGLWLKVSSALRAVALI